MSALIHEGPRDPDKPPVPGAEKPTTERKRKAAAAVKRQHKRLRCLTLPPKLY